MIVYDDSPEIKGSLEAAFSQIDVSFVNVNLKDKDGDTRIDCKGLDLALGLDPRERPIILYSLIARWWFANDMRFHALIGKRRVAFVEVPFNLLEVLQLVTQLQDDQKIEDLLAQRMLGVVQKQSLMAILRHDLGNALRYDSARVQEILRRARVEAGLTGTDEELIAAIQNPLEESAKGLYPGEYFPGVFCDLEGCLWKGDAVNEQVKSTLEAYEQDGKPITLWTGGDLKDLSKKVRLARLPWKVLPKWSLVGSKVEIVLDDEPQEKFEEEYHIECKEFLRVT